MSGDQSWSALSGHTPSPTSLRSACMDMQDTPLKSDQVMRVQTIRLLAGRTSFLCVAAVLGASCERELEAAHAEILRLQRTLEHCSASMRWTTRPQHVLAARHLLAAAAPSRPVTNQTTGSVESCRDDDHCLQKRPSWGSEHTCAGSTRYCKSYDADMYPCCPKSCNLCDTKPPTRVPTIIPRPTNGTSLCEDDDQCLKARPDWSTYT